LVYMAFYNSQPSLVVNVERGIYAAVTLVLVLGTLAFKDRPFIRPHPLFWRLVMAIGLVYQLFLVFLLFQNLSDVQQMMTFFDPSLGVPMPEQSYAEDCSLTWGNINSKLDVFVLAHSLGWFVKAIILRDYWFCWVFSIAFEVMEYSLEHQLHNFAECWWDHWIMDVLVCNWLGIYLGMRVCGYFNMKKYEWRGMSSIPSLGGKLKRAVAQFTPHDWTRFDWSSSKSFGNYLIVLSMLTLGLMTDLNVFYLKFLLWLPPNHMLLLYRTVIVSLATAPAVREAYQYADDPNCKRLGSHAWIVLSILVTELLICIKFGQGQFTDPWPVSVLAFWALLGVFLVVYPIWRFWLFPKPHNIEVVAGNAESRTAVKS